MYGDMIRKLVYNNLEDYTVGCKRSHLTEESITYAELSFKNDTKQHSLQMDTEVIIGKIKCDKCYCEPKKII